MSTQTDRVTLPERGTPASEWPNLDNREDFVRLAKTDPYSSAWFWGCDPRDIFDFEVKSIDEGLTMKESLLGTPLGSCMDYGRHTDLTDRELVEKELGDKFSFGGQFLGFMGPENENVADTIVIIRKENGYVKTNNLMLEGEA